MGRFDLFWVGICAGILGVTVALDPAHGSLGFCWGFFIIGTISVFTEVVDAWR